MFYRDDLAEKPLPDNWLKRDRNIGGLRGRFGRWYFAGVSGGGARDTFAGAMVSEPGRPPPVSGAFLAANIEVALGRNGRRDQTHLYLSGPDDVTCVEVAGEAGALGARYTLRKPYINSKLEPDVPPTPWQATQVWLFTRHALVGLLQLVATEEQTVPYIQGELRFGPRLPLERDDERTFRCGEVTLRLLEHDFATVSHGRARPGYAKRSTRHSAVTLRTAGDAFTARPGETVRYAAAIAPERSPSVSGFRRLEREGETGFDVQVGEQTFSVMFRPATATVRLTAKRND
jgi:hypothetical protein